MNDLEYLIKRNWIQSKIIGLQAIQKLFPSKNQKVKQIQYQYIYTDLPIWETDYPGHTPGSISVLVNENDRYVYNTTEGYGPIPLGRIMMIIENDKYSEIEILPYADLPKNERCLLDSLLTNPVRKI